MRRIIEFSSFDTENIFVEILEEGDDSVVKASRYKDRIEKSGKAFEESLKVIKSVIRPLVKELGNVSPWPEEFDIEFGIKMDAQIGSMVSATSGDSNFLVRVKWRTDKQNTAKL